MSAVAAQAKVITCQDHIPFQERWDLLPEDDEPISEAELRSIDDALENYKAGRCLSHEQVTGRVLRIHGSDD